MKPPRRANAYERVPVYDEWIVGKIDDIEYDLEHKKMWQGEEKVGPAVRFKFVLEGCKFPHRTTWLSFSYSERSNLYKKYIVGLVENPKPDLEFDLDTLKGMDVKVMYSQNGEYDNLEMIRPVGKKVISGAEPAEEVEGAVEDTAPF